MTDDDTIEKPLGPISAWHAWVALHGLSVLAISQPIYSQMARNPTFVAVHQLSQLGVWGWVLAIFFLPGAVATAAALGLSALMPSHRTVLVSTMVGILSGLVFLPVFNAALSNRALITIPLTMVLMAGAGTVFARAALARVFLRRLALTGPFLLGFFAFSANGSVLLFPPAAAASGPGGNDTPVMLIVLDEWPLSSLMDVNGELDRSRAPELVDFATEEATWYPNATTVSAWTKWAVPAILTGNQPDRSSFPTAGRHPDNLFTLTAASHELIVSETITSLCSTPNCPAWTTDAAFATDSLFFDTRSRYLRWLLPTRLQGLSQLSLSTFVDRLSPPTPEALANENLIQRQRLRLDEFRTATAAAEGPTVSYIHSLVTHAPWFILPDGTLYNGYEDLGLGSQITGTQRQIDQGVHRHLLQQQFADQVIGGLLDDLRDSGRFDETLIIITADHGASFIPQQPRRELVPANLPEIAAVPLFIKYPSQTEAAIDAVAAQSIDLLPTIADVLEIELPGEVDGQSLLGPQREVPIRQVFAAPRPTLDIDEPVDLTAAIERTVRVVPSGTSPDDIWGPVSLAQFHGQAVGSTESLRETEFAVVLDDADRFDAHDRNAEFIPIRIDAAATPRSASEGQPILLAVNGRIAGSSIIRSGIFSVLVDPALLESGSNIITAYTVREGELASVTLL